MVSRRGIAIFVGLSITFVVSFDPTLVLWINYPSVDITGTIDYTGLPEPKLNFDGGLRFLFVPEESERSKLSVDSRFDLLTLRGADLDPTMDGKNVTVRGIFVNDYSKYLRESFQGRLSSTPTGPVIIVRNIEVLN